MSKRAILERVLSCRVVTAAHGLTPDFVPPEPDVRRWGLWRIYTLPTALVQLEPAKLLALTREVCDSELDVTEARDVVAWLVSQPIGWEDLAARDDEFRYAVMISDGRDDLAGGIPGEDPDRWSYLGHAGNGHTDLWWDTSRLPELRILVTDNREKEVITVEAAGIHQVLARIVLPHVPEVRELKQYLKDAEPAFESPSDVFYTVLGFLLIGGFFAAVLALFFAVC